MTENNVVKRQSPEQEAYPKRFVKYPSAIFQDNVSLPSWAVT